MKRVSIGSWTYCLGTYQNNPAPWAEVLQKLKELHFDGVELGAFGVHPNPDLMPEKAQREACKHQVAEAGLAISGMAANLWAHHLIDSEDTTGYVEEFRKNLLFCVDLGVKAILVDTVQSPEVLAQMDADTAFRRAATAWKRCAREAADHGVYVSWEFETGYAFNTPSEILRVVDEVNDDNFGILFDLSHAHMVAAVGARQCGKKETLPGGALELARMLRGKINHVHLNDTLGPKPDGEPTLAPLGEGILDVDALIPELFNSGTAHDWWIMDLWLSPDAWAVTERCKRAVDKLNRD